MPIIFPICMIGIAIIYTTDILMLTYWYRKPPTYDNHLYLKALRILKFAPMTMFIGSYWAFTNPQIFENTKVEPQFANTELDTKHWVFDRSHLHQGHFVLFLMAFFFLMPLISRICMKDD